MKARILNPTGLRVDPNHTNAIVVEGEIEIIPDEPEKRGIQKWDVNCEGKGAGGGGGGGGGHRRIQII
jgi:hypothetical protein